MGLFLALVLSSLFHSSFSLRVTKNQAYPAVQGRFTTIETFDYNPDGSLDLSWLGTSPNEVTDLGFFLCDRQEYQDFRAKLKTKDSYMQYCIHDTKPSHSSTYQDLSYHGWLPVSSTPTCSINMVHIMDPILTNYTVQSHDRYVLGLLNCAACGYTTCQFSKNIRLKYSLLNPGSELSATDEPFLIIYPVFAGVWMLVVLVVLVMMGKSYYDTLGNEGREALSFPEIARQTHGAHKFHGLFLSVAFTKFCVVLLSWAYWFVFSHDGNRDSALKVATNVAYAVSECSLFCVLLLLAHGWCILSRLNNSEVRALSSSLLALLSSLLFFSFYDIVTSLLVLYIFLLPNIFANLTQNIDCLRFRILWVESVEDQIEEDDHEVWEWTRSALKTKLSAYQATRIAIALYFILHFLVKISSYFIPWFLEYLCTIFQETIVLLFVLATFGIVNPFRAKDGLFWIPSFAGDQDNYEAWVEATQRAYDQLASGEQQRFQHLVSSYNILVKDLHLIQFPLKNDEFVDEGVGEGKGEGIQEKKENEKGEDDEGGKLRNLYLAILMGQNPSPSVPLEEREERPESVPEESWLVGVMEAGEGEAGEGADWEEEAGEEDELISL